MKINFTLEIFKMFILMPYKSPLKEKKFIDIIKIFKIDIYLIKLIIRTAISISTILKISNTNFKSLYFNNFNKFINIILNNKIKKEKNLNKK